MRNLNRIVLIYLTLFPFFAFSQTDSVRHVRPVYFNQFLAGGLIGKGENGNSLSASSIHGVRIGKIGLAVGISADTYAAWKTVPVYASFSYDFAAIKNHSLFIQFDAGYAKVWHIDTNNDPFNYEEKGGRIFHPVIGYRIKTNQWSIYIKAGYKFQQIKYIQTYRWEDWGRAYFSNNVTRANELLSIQLGFGLH